MENVKTFLKNFTKDIFKSRIIKVIIPVILIVIILLSATVYYITLDDGKYKEGDMSSTPYAASTYIKKMKFTEDGIIFLYQYKDEATGEEIEEEKTSSEMAQILWDEMIKEGSTVNNYLSSFEELEKLMNTEIITQYPKLDTTVDLNGTVEFERHKTDGTSSMLKYVNLETFNQYIEEKNTEIVNYFTLDENENVLVGIVEEYTETLTSNDSEMVLSDYTSKLSEENLVSEGKYSKTEYVVYSKSINYKSIVSKYTLPFQYLWALIVIGDDKNVGLELADLVNDSQIIISIYDNIATTAETNKYTYKREKKVNVAAKATADTNYGTYTKNKTWKPAYEVEEDDEYEINDVVTYEENTPIVDVTTANVWIVDYTKEYTYQEAEQTVENTNSKTLEDTEYIAEEGNPQISSSGDGSDLVYYSEFKEKLNELVDELEEEVKDSVEIEVVNGVEKELEISTSITACKATYYKHNVNRTQEEVATVTSQKYVAGNVTNNPKIEKDAEENNIVKILSEKKHAAAREKITTEIPDWLFELLESNPDTVNMVDITKYIINKVLDKEKYKDIDIDFDSLYAGTAGNFETPSISGDINVSDESLFITDLEEIKEAFKAYSNSNKLIEYAQDFLDMQQKYKVNALFAAAVSISETGAGNAGNAIKIANSSNSVGAKTNQCWNNWFNIKANSAPYGILYNGEGESHYKIYNTVADSIDNFGNNIANGSYYYAQNKYTVDEIGHTYCPNSEAYPTQGDDWVKLTLAYITNFYSAVGINVGAPKEGTSDEKLNYLFPKGTPTTEADCSSYITTVSIALTNKDGTKTTGNISVHKDLANDVKNVFQTAQDAGFKIYEAYGYSYRKMNNGGSGDLSHHSYGVAIDINVNENYSHRGSVVYAGSFWDPAKSEFSIPKNGTLVKAFEAVGWKWGGNWSGNYQDFMHFSYTGK